MVDLNAPPTSPKVGESSKIKSLMGRTPGIIKLKFLTVLGNSNEILNGISNKLTLSSSSDDCDDDEEVVIYDDTIDYSKIDFESRRVKARRAHEEIISGKFRHPNLIPKRLPEVPSGLENAKAMSSSSSSKSSSYSNNSIDSKSPIRGDSDNMEDEMMKEVNGILRDTSAIDVVPPPRPCTPLPPEEKSDKIDSSTPADVLDPKSKARTRGQKMSNSTRSSLTCLDDFAGIPASRSVDSTSIKQWIRSESQDSEQSWASSIDVDSQTEVAVKEFMKQFVEILFTSSSTIQLELKSEFGQMARTESGRLWFSRFVQAQRAKSKKVDESTFYSLVQYFAIVLFECAENEDYSPAKSLMNMCFTFYHEIEVPGCEPYREYLFTYLRQQPIWHTLRFWNAAFFDALQCQRAHRPVPKNKLEKKSKPDEVHKSSLPESDDEKSVSSSSSSSHHDCDLDDGKDAIRDDQTFQQNITFGQLGAFTCNMHAFGLSRDLCLEFLIKQGTIANLPKDQLKILRDNINRMYHETEKWGAKET